MKIFVALVCVIYTATAYCDSSFEKTCADACKSISPDSIAYYGKEGWLYTRAELSHLSKGKFWGKAAVKTACCRRAGRQDPTPAIVDFNNQLKKLGIKLILLPVPPKATVYPEGLGSFSTTAANKFLAQFYQHLSRAGVDVLDLHDKFVALKGGQHRLYCQQDSHWSGYGCEVAARQLAKIIMGMAWYKTVHKTEFKAKKLSVTIAGDLWKSLKKPEVPKENVTLRFITGKTVAKDSPILLLGDSHTLIFHAGDDMLAKKAGLLDQLAYELKIPIDLLAVRGSGATAVRIALYRKAKHNPAWLKNKKVIIWCFTARDFTEAHSGWRKIPVLRKRR